MAHPQKDTIYFDFVSQPSRAVVLFVRWDSTLSLHQRLQGSEALCHICHGMQACRQLANA